MTTLKSICETCKLKNKCEKYKQLILGVIMSCPDYKSNKTNKRSKGGNN